MIFDPNAAFHLNDNRENEEHTVEGNGTGHEQVDNEEEALKKAEALIDAQHTDKVHAKHFDWGGNDGTAKSQEQAHGALHHQHFLFSDEMVGKVDCGTMNYYIYEEFEHLHKTPEFTGQLLLQYRHQCNESLQYFTCHYLIKVGDLLEELAQEEKFREEKFMVVSAEGTAEEVMTGEQLKTLFHEEYYEKGCFNPIYLTMIFAGTIFMGFFCVVYWSVYVDNEKLGLDEDGERDDPSEESDVWDDRKKRGGGGRGRGRGSGRSTRGQSRSRPKSSRSSPRKSTSKKKSGRSRSRSRRRSPTPDSVTASKSPEVSYSH